MHLKDRFDVVDQELDKKKKGKAAEPKLTKKQQEDIDAELQRESETRARIQQVGPSLYIHPTRSPLVWSYFK